MAETNTAPTEATAPVEDEPLPEEAAEKEEADAWKEFEAAEKGEDPDADDNVARAEDAQPAADEAAAEDKQPTDDESSGDKPDDKPDESEAEPSDKDDVPKDDIWKTATPEQRAAFEAAQNDAKKELEFSGRMRGQVSGLTRKVNSLQARTTVPAADSAAEGTTEPNALFETEGWKNHEKDYPEVAGPTKALVGAMLAEIQTLKQGVTVIASDRQSDHLAVQAQIVYDAHPDYDDIAKSEAFAKWYETQPAFVRAGIEHNAVNVEDGNEVVHIVKMFKQETGAASSEPPESAKADEAEANGHDSNQALDGKRRRQLESATSPRTRSPGAVTSGAPDEPEAAWKYFEKMGL